MKPAAARVVMVALTLAVLVWGHVASAEDERNAAAAAVSIMLGRPTDRAITLNLFACADGTARVEYGTTAGQLESRTPVVALKKDAPVEVSLAGLATAAARQYGLPLLWRQIDLSRNIDVDAPFNAP